MGGDYTGLGGTDTSLGLEETKYAVLGRQSLSATLTAIDQSGDSYQLSVRAVQTVTGRVLASHAPRKSYNVYRKLLIQ